MGGTSGKPEDSALEYLKGLDRDSLIIFLAGVLSARRDERRFDDGGFEIEALCIAECSYGSFNGKTDDAPMVEFVGRPVAGHEPIGTPVVAEQGACPKCGISVLSVAKLASCPICSADVECT